MSKTNEVVLEPGTYDCFGTGIIIGYTEVGEPVRLTRRAGLLFVPQQCKVVLDRSLLLRRRSREDLRVSEAPALVNPEVPPPPSPQEVMLARLQAQVDQLAHAAATRQYVPTSEMEKGEAELAAEAVDEAVAEDEQGDQADKEKV